ncbi:globin domain-containing protein [Arcobacter porcinus]|uniref:Globin n=1 Tax=Arcobacter porcinus TaxID=1935204 RepID=A0A1C0AUX5_9BACT|nr:globin [Arcobacter porcinus]OCL96620.1 Group 2 truncated hemoglobin YjbI [Aliarcobacter thereius]OCL83660.1 Group 2 truncated hemoglobin YjbI [Arcobacter porcinus]OCL83879.1 Group 2 truncated hemoglobin YjbI [Arcobacter porcinus]OCL85853.1 Group 2 truncated hemoglobin YjbI [Arcobacter porcinus]OCL89968.1 Group 2 truncated hemoglobin YjbI [Arcobacter porcinus]
MQFTITKGIFGERPAVKIPDKRFLELIGEDGIRKIISEHYDILVESEIKDLFPPVGRALEMAKKHSADFFIQICGGPKYFNESRGAPMMFVRHQPFKITPEAREVWLKSYIPILENIEIEEELMQSFWNYLDIFSIWMINTPSEN